MKHIMIKYNHILDRKKTQLHSMDTNSLLLSIITKNIIRELKNHEDIFDFNNLRKDHQLHSNKNKKVLGKCRMETALNILIDEFNWLRSNASSFKCRNNLKNELQGISISNSKNIKIKEYYNCLFGGEKPKECDNYIFRSINHDMYLQQVQISTLSPFEDKRCFEKNIESKPRNYY